ncbi:MAG: gliding motility-associated C-terminal domain-containing protein [Saprospiraceae bacterium]|nr:gliding motility-associated C-terminal domain-containing protein [Saprospiraceae bacterium]
MTKNLSVFSLLLLLAFTTSAQNVPFCAADLFYHQADEATKLKQLELDAAWAAHTPAQSRSNVETIPVVFHLVHNNGPENLTDAQVTQALAWLNQAYNNSGPFFQGSGADVQIQFCPAQRTPNNLAANGITRTVSTLTNLTVESQDGQLKNLIRWEPKEYINIWVVSEINSTTYGPAINGYAYFPSFHGNNADGIVIEANRLLSSGDIASLVHEMGHYWGLYHTFQGGCNNNNCLTDGDRVCDTPPDQSTSWLLCGQTVNTCNTEVPDVPDMTNNFLDYGNSNCMHDFSQGQADRMNFFLEGARASLLESKGCLPPCPTLVTAAFVIPAGNLYAGQTVQFSNTSQNAIQYQWQVNGQTISTQPQPGYTFTTPGVYTVQLTAFPVNTTLCEPDSVTQTVQVVCPVTASVSVSNTSPVIYEPVVVTNNSQNTTQTTWLLNGQPLNPAPDTLVFDTEGSYLLEITTGNGFCEASDAVLVLVQDSCRRFTFVKEFVGQGYSEPKIIPGPDNDMVVAGAGGGIYGYVQTDGLGNLTLDRISSTVSGYVKGAAILQDGRVALIGNNEFLDEEGLVILVENDGTASARSYVPLNPQFDVMLAVRATSDGGFIVCGSSRPSSGGVTGGLYLKFDASFNLEWSRNYRDGFTVVYDIQQLDDGGFIACGVHPSGSQIAGLIHRLDAAGNLVWSKNYNTPASGAGFMGLAAIPGGDFLLAGQTQGYYAPQDYLCIDSELWMTRITASGDVVWSNLYTIPEPLCLHNISATAQGSLLLCGVSAFVNPKPFFLHIGPNEQVFFSKRPDVPGRFTSIAPLNDGGYALTLKTDQEILQLHRVDALGNNGTCSATDLLLTITPVVVMVGDAPMTSGAVAPLAFRNEYFYEGGPATTTLCEFTCDNISPKPEICNNGQDDDADGLFDCLDPDCDCPSNPCEPSESNLWYFGLNKGLDFSTDPPTELNDGQTSSQYGNNASVINDAQGNLIMYSDGLNVFNRNHQVMPNGVLSGLVFSAETMILPHPGEPGEYYVINAGPFVSDDPRYAVVDMALDNGLGDVVPGQKDLSLIDLPPFESIVVSPNIVAVRSCSFDGYWVLLHSVQGNQFLRYRIDQDGLYPLPVVTPIGTAPNIPNFFVERILKFSPDGTRIALSAGKDYIELFDFDPTLFGLVSNAITVTMPEAGDIGGLEFSPEGRFLYVVVVQPDNAKSQIWQFDLTASSGPGIEASGILVGEKPISLDISINKAQLAPNGKIYLASTVNGLGAPSTSLDIIHQPDVRGVACLFQPDGLPLSGSGGSLGGLCNFPASFFRKPNIDFSDNATDSICLLGASKTLQYQIKYVDCGVDSIRWELFGLSGSIEENYQYANVTYTEPGEGLLVVTAVGDCIPAADTLHIRVFGAQPQGIDLGPDTVTVCDNGIATFNAGSGWSRYRWPDGTVDSTFSTLLPGTVWVEVWDACNFRYTDTVTVLVAPESRLSVGLDTSLCSGTDLFFQRPPNFTTWQWTPEGLTACDTCLQVTVPVNNDQTFILFGQTTDGCISLDTFTINVLDTLFFTQNFTFCNNDSVLVFGVSLPADTTALFFFQNNGAGCDSLFTVNTTGIEQPILQIDTSICDGQTFVYQGFEFPSDTFALVSLPSPAGCDTLLEISVSPLPQPTIQLPADTTLKIGGSITLAAQVTGFAILSWTPSDGLSCNDCLSPEADPLETTLYSLQATNANGCTAVDEVLITVLNECFLYIPNAFTPDGDGTNDVFYPRTDPCVKRVLSFAVFNRWGKAVFARNDFEPNEASLGWNGDGHPMDVYLWKAELEYVDGRVENLQGEVTLFR